VPTLDAAALKSRIAARQLDQVHLLWGEDVRRLDASVDAIEATIDEADRAFAVERVYAGEAGGLPIDIAASARVYPMLGDRRLVIVLRAEKFLKPKRAGKPGEDDAPPAEEDDAAADLRPLEEYLASPVPFTTLVFVASDVDRSRRFTKLVMAKALVTDYPGLPAGVPGAWREARGQAMAQVDRAMREAGRTIDPAATSLIADRTGGDISHLRDDIERLLLYTSGRPHITREDAAEIVSTNDATVDDWAVVNALEAGNTAKALTELGRRFARGDSPHAVVGQLRWWVSSKLAEGQPARVPAALDALLQTDLALKSSGGDEQMLVERLVIALGGPALRRY
jgi:DNA polymerase III delta subunit